MSNYTSNDIVNAIAAAAKALAARKEEINRLNVFPVPDGDTGTNMCQTMNSAVKDLRDRTFPSVYEVANCALPMKSAVAPLLRVL